MNPFRVLFRPWIRLWRMLPLLDRWLVGELIGPLLFGIGLSGAAAQWLYSIALKYTPAAIVAVVNYSSIVWATLFGWLVWSEWPLPIVLMGAAVIISANLLIAWREHDLSRSLRSKMSQIP